MKGKRRTISDIKIPVELGRPDGFGTVGEDTHCSVRPMCAQRSLTFRRNVLAGHHFKDVLLAVNNLKGAIRQDLEERKVRGVHITGHLRGPTIDPTLDGSCAHVKGG